MNCTYRFESKRTLLKRRSIADPSDRFILRLVFLATLFFLPAGPVEAASLTQGLSAFRHQNYVVASNNLIPLAEHGNPVAQFYIGFMFETGRGVPQNYTEAAMWYRRAAEQGHGGAQYSLGLLYDKGFGVPRDVVEANKWAQPVDVDSVFSGSGGAHPDTRCLDIKNDTRRNCAGARAGAVLAAGSRTLDYEFNQLSISHPIQIAGARNSPKGSIADVLSGRL